MQSKRLDTSMTDEFKEGLRKEIAGVVADLEKTELTKDGLVANVLGYDVYLTASGITVKRNDVEVTVSVMKNSDTIQIDVNKEFALLMERTPKNTANY